MPKPLPIASALLGRLQLFRNVEIESISDRIAACGFRQLQKGDLLLSPKQENDSVYLVISGRLEVYLDLQEDSPLTVVEPGECVGEMSIIEGKNPSAYVIASEASEIMEIPQQVLWGMIDDSHQITRNMLHIMSLKVRLSNVVISDSLDTQKEYMRNATIDALTGVHNRRWMESMFEQELVHAKRDNRALGLIMVDVDNFKQYNDRFGHLQGDQVLVSVAKTLRSYLRPNDMLARFGGEEFAIMLPETTLEEALELAEVLRQQVEECEIRQKSGEELPGVTISSGVTSLAAGEDINLQNFIEHADSALYRAKESGRNCVSR